MSFAKVGSAQPYLLTASILAVEADIARGLHSFTIVGLPDKAVEESRDRVSAAIKNSGFVSPKSKNHKVTISLAPADIKKEGPAFDLPIALAYLLASGDIAFKPEGKLFLGELSLDGMVRKVSGVLSAADTARKEGFSEIYVPTENAAEAALIEGITVFPVETLSELIEHLTGKKDGKPSEKKIMPAPPTEIKGTISDPLIALEDIRGQESGKRALIIAAAGGHNIVLYGPPGTGKSMLAKAFVSLLPPLPQEEVLEVTGIHSVAGALSNEPITAAPLRSPHHTASYVSLVGGGTFPKPGEITLAHRGVLFMDEFPEFDRRVIDAMRQPLEDRVVSISRVKGSARFPANFILIAAMNPCPCGNFGSSKVCVCTPVALSRYQRKISGPIIDRIDLWIEVPHIDHEKLSGKRGEEGETKRAQEIVARARNIQRARFKNKEGISKNSDMGVKDLEDFVELTPSVKKLLNDSAKKLDLSPRSYHRVIKIARTIADVDEKSAVGEEHILEALRYRPKQTHS